MIESQANPHIKHIRSLAADRKDRRRERLFVLEGVRLVADTLEGSELALAVYAPDQLDQTVAGRELRVRLEQMPHAYAATAQVIAAASDTVNPQGVVALAHWPQVDHTRHYSGAGCDPGSRQHGHAAP